MDGFFWAKLLQPFALLAWLGALLLVRYLVIWFMPESKLKNLLLLRVDRRGQSQSTGSAEPPK